MSRHGDIEDLFLELLLATEQTGVFKELKAVSATNWQEAAKQIINARTPACLIASGGMKPSPLRAGLNYDQEFSVSLMLSATNLRGQEAARKGDTNTPGVYELMDITKNALLGKEPSGFGIIEPGPERRLFATKTTVVWAQEWKLIRYA